MSIFYGLATRRLYFLKKVTRNSHFSRPAETDPYVLLFTNKTGLIPSLTYSHNRPVKLSQYEALVRKLTTGLNSVNQAGGVSSKDDSIQNFFPQSEYVEMFATFATTIM